MSIDRDGWIDWAIIAPGIPDKTYTAKNKGIGIIGHSIVGSYESAISRFMSTKGYEDPSGDWVYTNYASASCMFIITYEGELIQMYPVTASTWTSGGYEANTSYWAVEMEGGLNPFNEPLTDAQVACMMRLAREWEAHKGRKFVIGEQFREHGEIALQYGYAPTACPSNRYERFKTAWREQDMGMTLEEQQKLNDLHLLVTLLRKIVVENGYTVPFRRYEDWPGDDGYKARIIACFPTDAVVGREYKLIGKVAFDYSVLLGLSFAEAQSGLNKAVNKHLGQEHVSPFHAHEIPTIAPPHQHHEYAPSLHQHDYAAKSHPHTIEVTS